MTFLLALLIGLSALGVSDSGSSGITGLRAVTVAVRSMEKSLDLYERQLGMKRAAEAGEPAGGPSLLIPPGRKNRVVTLRQEGAGLADLRLLEIGGKAEPIREGVSPWDWAIFHMGFLTANVDRMRTQLEGAGFLCKAVAKYQSHNPGGTVQETICRGPQEEAFQLTQGENPGDGLRGISDLAISTKDATLMLPFYEQGLGLKKVSDATYANDGIREVVGLPTGGKLRVVTLAAPADPNTRVRLLEFYDGGGWRLLGKSLGDRARPPRHGIYLLTFEVSGLDATLQRCQQNGGRLVVPPSGSPRAATVSSPDGVLIELVERK